MTEIQQELVDINQRYDLMGDRLADRHQELQNMLSSTKTFLQDMADLMTWVDLKELDASLSPSLPTSEREAKKQLKLQDVSCYHLNLNILPLLFVLQILSILKI